MNAHVTCPFHLFNTIYQHRYHNKYCFITKMYYYGCSLISQINTVLNSAFILIFIGYIDFIIRVNTQLNRIQFNACNLFSNDIDFWHRLILRFSIQSIKNMAFKAGFGFVKFQKNIHTAKLRNYCLEMVLQISHQRE